ncbi:hypothetical protein EV382_2571 [Micromonospora violae]|uniref:Uncharacterized protein n=1 Tax=Micromonospora violae TaxID=1278207 RepID=A0A4Q7UIN1_9ACTN|nr:hypothetical protein [Micromonospora violae]RZT79373.1 hypothetical protein EV382_2571 [Micromonospora violae]
MGGVRGHFRDDLARHPAPPLGDLVEQAVVQGRRLRRRRRLAQVGASGSAVVMLLVIGLAVGPLGDGADESAQRGGWNGGSPGDPVGTATPSPGGFEKGVDDVEPEGQLVGPTPSPTVIDTVRIGVAPGGEQLTTTPQGALELLTRLLPRGKTSGYVILPSTGAGPGMPYVQLYLDRGNGPGMVRLSIHQDNLGGDLAPGTVELTEIPDNCVQNKVVTVHHRGGLQVDVMIATCRSWDGKGNWAAPSVLSVKEATEIAANPSWGTTMPAEFVQSGAKNFASVARSNG